MNSVITRVNTLIIGAGISGTKIAVDLLNANNQDFLIIEALDRIGGRIHSIKTQGLIIYLKFS
jgi:cation diffusion facilitator CzcD-associated flavoprotein CzcO